MILICCVWCGGCCVFEMFGNSVVCVRFGVFVGYLCYGFVLMWLCVVVLWGRC